MRYEQKQIDQFLSEAKTSSMDILELSKKHGIHPHTGNIWARRFLPKKVLEAIRARGRHIRALHAAATRVVNSAAKAGAGTVAAKAGAGTVAAKASHQVKVGGPSRSRAVQAKSIPKQKRSSRQALAALKARLLAMLDDVSKLQAAGA